MTDAAGPAAPRDSAKLALALASRGTCEFEGCGAPLGLEGVVVGQIAHIHSPKPDGPRHDPTLSAERVHSLPNLMYLCGTHHPLVDKKPSDYSAEALKAMKASHEAGNILVTADVLQRLVESLERPAASVPEHWWERPGVPIFQLGLGSARPNGQWEFNAEPKQIDSSDIGNLRCRWRLGDDDPPFEPPSLITCASLAGQAAQSNAQRSPA